jgi:hypothetical protein
MSNGLYIAISVVTEAAISVQPPIHPPMARGFSSPLLASSLSIFISIGDLE